MMVTTRTYTRITLSLGSLAALAACGASRPESLGGGFDAAPYDWTAPTGYEGAAGQGGVGVGGAGAGGAGGTGEIGGTGGAGDSGGTGGAGDSGGTGGAGDSGGTGGAGDSGGTGGAGDSGGTGGAGLPAAADPGAPGPYLAGVMTLTLTDPSRNRTFDVELWYPVDPAADDGSDNRYELDTPLGTIFRMPTPARRDASPAAGGPWPLVIFSHGYGGVRFQSYFFTEHLATHGIVVAAPDHPGNTLFSAFLGGDNAAIQSSIDRPLDVIFVLDSLRADAPLPLDPSRVASSGHSFGGWTSLEVARRDSRFGVVVALAPGFRQGATPDFVAALARPIALFGGSEDSTTPFDSDQELPYQLAQTPKALLEVLGAGHLDFSNLCSVPLMPTFVGDGCDADLIEPAVVHARVNTVATAFLLRYLADRAAYDAYLAKPSVEALGDVAYWSEP